jgi:excisionase family DNA binding protein
VAPLTLREAARRTGRSRDELMALVDDGRLRAHVAGGRLVMDEADLLAVAGSTSAAD